jgi:hypothetical protein
MTSGAVPPSQNQIRRILASPDIRLFQQPRLIGDILTGVLERLLIPRNQTSGTECQLWPEIRPLSPQQQTFRAGTQNVSD